MLTDIKSYPSIVTRNSLSSFGISRMEDIYHKRGGQADEPHSHKYYTVLLVKQAKGQHFIDFNEYPLHGKQVFFIAPGQVHQVVESEVSYGYSMVFSEEFLLKNNLPASFLDEINLFQDYDSCPPLEVEVPLMTQLANYCEEMLELYRSNQKLKEKAVVALLELFLIRCLNSEQLSELENTQMDSAHSLLGAFKELIDAHFKEWHQTYAYAEALYITPDHLSKTVKAITGKTAKEHIQSRVTVAAKRLLYFSDKTTKEIAYELGFSEVANFSAYFKKCTGVSPSTFRKNSNG